MIRHHVIPRSRWGASAPHGPIGNMIGVQNGMFVHHTVGAAPMNREAECAEMRNLQQVAWARGFNDISYSFVIFPSGRIYEGRGKNAEGAHTLHYNDTSYGVAAAGSYDVMKPTDAMIAAYRWLRRKYLRLESRPLRAHSSVYATECPGQWLKARMGEM